MDDDYLLDSLMGDDVSGSLTVSTLASTLALIRTILSVDRAYQPWTSSNSVP
jgi:hypothetical protein